MKNPRLIVLTGGPGAGKTAILELARKTFVEDVLVLPEAATILFGGGFWREPGVSAKRAAQRAIYHVQRELERMALETRKACVILCDRGTLDGLAYWPGPAREFFAELQTTRESELSRYHAVIHLRTPSQERGYNHANPLRIETAAEAAELDERIVEVWSKHPRRFVIGGAPEFFVKAQSAMALLRELIAEKGKRVGKFEALRAR